MMWRQSLSESGSSEDKKTSGERNAKISETGRDYDKFVTHQKEKGENYARVSDIKESNKNIVAASSSLDNLANTAVA